MKFLPDVKLSGEARNQKKIDINVLVCNLQTSQVMSTFFFRFRASSLGLTSGKNFMIIRPVVSEILGGMVPTPPQMLVSCQKEQMLFNH